MNVGVLNTMIGVPLWLIMTLSLVSAIAGELVTVLVILILGRREEKASKTAIQHELIEGPIRVSPEAIAKVMSNQERTRPLPKRSKGDSKVQLSEAGHADLERRVAQRMNYRVNEVADLLGVPAKDVTQWLAREELQSIVSGDGIRWILSGSVQTLVNRLAPQEEVASPAEEVAAPAPKAGKAAKQLFKQMYWYYVDGNDKGIATLREAVAVVGHVVAPGDPVSWNHIPAALKVRIQRVKVQGEGEVKSAPGSEPRVIVQK